MKNTKMVLMVIIIFVVIGICLPNSFTVKRSIIIGVNSRRIHNMVSDLEQWSSWIKFRDQSVRLRYGVISSGDGAILFWEGLKENGQLTIVSSSPGKGIFFETIFNDYIGTCNGSLLYESIDARTYVTWEIQGRISTPIIGGYLALLMDPWIGYVLEKNLYHMKNVVERNTKLWNEITDRVIRI